MSATAIKQKLHTYLEIADEKKLKAIYTMMETEIEESIAEYSDSLKKELDQRHDEYKKGKAKIVTASESKKRIRRILTDAAKK